MFVIPSLEGGGAERVVANILCELNKSSFEGLLVVFDAKVGYGVPDGITLTSLDVKDSSNPRYKIIKFFLIIRRLSRLITDIKPDVVVSFMWYLNFLALVAVSISRSSTHTIVSERLSVTGSSEGLFAELIRRTVIKYFYPLADMIIVNSNAMKTQLNNIFHIREEKIVAIHNPVNIDRAIKLSEEPIEHPWFQQKIPVIIGVGRLAKQKGFDHLIKAIKRLNATGTECRLILLGKGPEEANLKALVAEQGIGTKVLFPGFQQNPYKYLARSTVFVLSSLYEGFPNALLEAMALGVPSIATRCPTGPEEIIEDGVEGILVPSADEKALAGAIKKLLLDKGLRRRFGEAGRKRAEDFEAKKIVSQYESVIGDVSRDF